MLNYSVRGEINLRTFEAIASGCVLMAEASNEAVASALRPGREYIPYDLDTLTDEAIAVCNNRALRLQVVNAAQSRLPRFSFEQLLKDALAEHLAWLLDRGVRWDRARWDRSRLEQQWLLTSDASCEAVDLYEHSANQARASLLTSFRPLSTEGPASVTDHSSADRAPAAADLLVMAELAARSQQAEAVQELAVAVTAACGQGRFGNPATIPVPDFSWWRMSLETDLLEPGASPERWLRSRAMWLAPTNLLSSEPALPTQLGFNDLSEVPELLLLAAAQWDAVGEHCAAAATALRVHEISPRNTSALSILDEHIGRCACLEVDLNYIHAMHSAAIMGLADGPTNDATHFLAHLDARSDV
ncbi:glycosyltransferase family 1 protein [Dactylosporangium roseum]|uniref:Glycosyltransferase family 1 protein n=2 Tax=Dactylosporangium roseum TaxID=47989 RepID=A0ABY5Z3H2_9ACTN|nr:glycosyltransferase [Dactylosporangium roseum]UWZ36565.1 glycosyltransferase family 1 protein [Dactylosporangium roseum]